MAGAIPFHLVREMKNAQTAGKIDRPTTSRVAGPANPHPVSERRGVQHIVCLGDTIGYGPNPIECMDLVMTRCRAALMGNHDFAVFYEPYNFNAGAEAACFWTRRCFENDADTARRAQRWRFLGNLPVRQSEKDTPQFAAYVKEYPGGQKFFDNLANAKQARPTVAGYEELSRNVGDGIAKVLQGAAEPKEALDEAARKSADALEN